MLYGSRFKKPKPIDEDPDIQNEQIVGLHFFPNESTNMDELKHWLDHNCGKFWIESFEYREEIFEFKVGLIIYFAWEKDKAQFILHWK